MGEGAGVELGDSRVLSSGQGRGEDERQAQQHGGGGHWMNRPELSSSEAAISGDCWIAGLA